MLRVEFLHHHATTETDAEALAWCCEWVSGLQAFVMNLDHQVRAFGRCIGSSAVVTLERNQSNYCLFDG